MAPLPQPSKKPWVKLISYVNDEFKAGRVVQVFDAKQVPPSPTEYINQPKAWQRADTDTQYRIRKRYRKWTYQVVPSPSIGTSEVIPHARLSTTRGGPAGQAVYSDFGPGFVYYLAERMSVKFGDKTLEVPVNTGVTIVCQTSGANGPNRILPSMRTNVKHAYYVVNYFVQVETWHYVPCANGQSFANLEEITDDNILKKIKRKTLAAPVVVSAERLNPAQRIGQDPVLAEEMD
ncbi:hypothetical protein TRAPUB_7872 [Trametes pubescens]|uniref:Uncharacterized protein n=1 Tax=Trametes pubescens TaxID=154538 RepID=A0A1M2V258_TRAPU|nr:hypothetical protein TRAPUB_7872 [Trametes pubescens]